MNDPLSAVATHVLARQCLQRPRRHSQPDPPTHPGSRCGPRRGTSRPGPPQRRGAASAARQAAAWRPGTTSVVSDAAASGRAPVSIAPKATGTATVKSIPQPGCGPRVPHTPVHAYPHRGWAEMHLRRQSTFPRPILHTHRTAVSPSISDPHPLALVLPHGIR